MVDNGNRDWFVYVLRCSNGALYTGVTTDVSRRVREHVQKGRLSARFTRAFAPVELAYSCRVGEKSLAYRTEYRMKKLTRDRKNIVVSEGFPKLMLLEFLDIDE
jgi:putative endonuclease